MNISIHTRSATYYEYAYCYCSVRGDGHTEMGDDSDIDEDIFIAMMQESDRLAPPEQRLEAISQANMTFIRSQHDFHDANHRFINEGGMGFFARFIFSLMYGQAVLQARTSEAARPRPTSRPAAG